MGTGRGKDGWARVSSSESTATRRHLANGGGVCVPKEVDLAHAPFSCLQKYAHMFARVVRLGTMMLSHMLRCPWYIQEKTKQNCGLNLLKILCLAHQVSNLNTND